MVKLKAPKNCKFYILRTHDFHVLLQGKNGTFELYLVGDNGVFDVTPFKGINEASFLIRVNNPSYLDYEKVTVMNFSIVAKEIVSKDPKMR